MQKEVYNRIIQNKIASKKSLAVLIDPDKTDLESCRKTVHIAVECKVDYLMIGGSLITYYNTGSIIKMIKSITDTPVILFPGNSLHLDPAADALLLLSLISGRNPELLIGQHVIAAPIIRKSNIEVISTGYLLVDCGKPTSVSYISNTTPIPYDKPSIAACTAMAGEMLGMKIIFMDGGSGASTTIDRKMIAVVSKSVSCPLIVGGGIDTAGKAVDIFNAGADIITIGNGIEKDINLLIDVCDRINDLNNTRTVDF